MGIWDELGLEVPQEGQDARADEMMLFLRSPRGLPAHGHGPGSRGTGVSAIRGGTQEHPRPTALGPTWLLGFLVGSMVRTRLPGDMSPILGRKILSDALLGTICRFLPGKSYGQRRQGQSQLKQGAARLGHNGALGNVIHLNCF